MLEEKEKKINELTEKKNKKNSIHKIKFFVFNQNKKKKDYKHYYEKGNQLKNKNTTYKENMVKLNKISEYNSIID